MLLPPSFHPRFTPSSSQHATQCTDDCSPKIHIATSSRSHSRRLQPVCDRRASSLPRQTRDTSLQAAGAGCDQRINHRAPRAPPSCERAREQRKVWKPPHLSWNHHPWAIQAPCHSSGSPIARPPVYSRTRVAEFALRIRHHTVVRRRTRGISGLHCVECK